MFERSMDYHERLILSLDRRMRSLTAFLTTSAPAAPHGPWNSQTSIEELNATSSVYFDAKEFLDIDAISSGAARFEAQLYAPASLQITDKSAEDAATATLNYSGPGGVDSALEVVEDPAFFEVASVISESLSNGIGKGATRSLRHRMKYDSIRPKQHRNWLMTAEKKAFGGKWRRTWSKLVS
ncbi:hypothetical protein EG328_005320 [Venturia inaequalis]|nr:hypothetical protein EG328_005320 [Venturia inaequalis]